MLQYLLSKNDGIFEPKLHDIAVLRCFAPEECVSIVRPLQAMTLAGCYVGLAGLKWWVVLVWVECWDSPELRVLRTKLFMS